MMKRNILKAQLVALFTLTLFSFVTFYFGDSLPDNVFTITSDNAGYTLTYYLFSIITYASYFTGPWIVVPFFVFSVAFPLIYDKREFMVDAANILPLTFLFAGLTFFFYPEALGSGLHFVFKEFFDPIWLGVYTFAALGLFLFGTFRASFGEYLMATANWLKELPAKTKANYQRVAALFKREKKERVPSQLDVKKRVENMLKVENKPQPQEAEEKVGLKEKLASKMPLFNKEQEPANAEDTQQAPVALQGAGPTGVEEEGYKKDLTGMTPNEQRSQKIQRFNNMNPVVDEKKDKQYFSFVDALNSGKGNKVSNEPDAEYFEQIIGLLESKLGEFKIEGKIVNVLKGPVVDTFELELGQGVKVSKVTGASEDLSLALFGIPIRIVYPMKGRTTVGIEVPRNPRDIIYLDEVLDTKEFQKSEHALPIAMGKDAFGETFVIDLAACPHMLVAGATGAGKSVFINSLLVSLLVKKSPKKMKLILIDPKQLELALYHKLPHLIMPVVTDAKTASIALLWAAQEMDRRYTILKEFGVRNIAGFNEKLKRATPEMLANIHQLYEDQGAEDYELPYIVVVVDEFADLILTKAGKEIEQNIARLAAKARAAGIHLVLATQRPSVDVITGVIKSNFPTRVSFRVTSQTDSRTILDKIGAERLLGKGDMLYKAGINTQRVHSSYVDEDEIEAFTKKLEGISQEFNENAMDFLESGGEMEVDEFTPGSHVMTPDKSDDAMYGEALKVVAESRSASASMLQRRLRIGYNRAANLIEEMERRGVVGPQQGSKPRKVLMSGDPGM